jgi:hypothetical protein
MERMSILAALFDLLIAGAVRRVVSAQAARHNDAGDSAVVRAGLIAR